MKRKISGIKERLIKTNIGTIPVNEYLDIIAYNYGYENYEDLKKHGYHLEEEKKKYIKKRV